MSNSIVNFPGATLCEEDLRLLERLGVRYERYFPLRKETKVFEFFNGIANIVCYVYVYMPNKMMWRLCITEPRKSSEDIKKEVTTGTLSLSEVWPIVWHISTDMIGVVDVTNAGFSPVGHNFSASDDWARETDWAIRFKKMWPENYEEAIRLACIDNLKVTLKHADLGFEIIAIENECNFLIAKSGMIEPESPELFIKSMGWVLVE